MSEQKTVAQRYEDLKRRWPLAVSRRDRLVATREAEQARLAELQKEALALFGTSDLNELRLKHQEIERERERIVFEAEMEVSNVETGLADVERQSAV